MLKKELVIEMRNVMMAVMQQNHEQWVTGKQLAAQIGCFNETWLKNYGQSLPRTRAIVTDKQGIQHEGSWIYPLHRIQRMIENDNIKKLKICKQSQE